MRWLLITVAVIAGGCAAQTNDGAGDAPIARVDTGGWTVINSPDRYPNVAWKCTEAGNGIYTARNADNTAARTLQVVPADPACKTQP